MSELSPQLQQLVLAGKLASCPSDADRARVFSCLEARLAMAGAAAEGGVHWGAPIKTTRSLAAKAAGITAVAVMTIGGGALTYSLTREPPPRVGTPTTPAPAQAVFQAPSPEANEIEVAPKVESLPVEEAGGAVDNRGKSATKSGVARASGRTHDTLSEEVAILSRAQSELHAGRASSALNLLAEHERRFRRGILAQERTAAKIQALCALGRNNEANAMLSGLAPQSVGEASARQACSGARKTTPNR